MLKHVNCSLDCIEANVCSDYNRFNNVCSAVVCTPQASQIPMEGGAVFLLIETIAELVFGSEQVCYGVDFYESNNRLL